jgi:hypothetical protein
MGGPLPQQVLADVGAVGHDQEAPFREPPRHHRNHPGGQLTLGAVVLLGLAPLLLVHAPQQRQAEVAVRPAGQFHDDSQEHPVVAEAEHLVLLGTQDRIQKDAAEGHLGAPLVTQRIIDHQPDPCPGHQRRQDAHREQAADLVPVPHGLAEQAEGRRVVALLSLAGGLPDAADGAPAQADDPGRDHLAEQGMDFLAKRGRQVD